MHIRFISLFLLSTISFFVYSQTLPGELYSLKDLTILAQTGPIEEFLQHAHDIRPTLRNSDWDKLVIKVVNKKMQELLDKVSFDKDDFHEVYKFTSWAPMKNSVDFGFIREKWSKKFFQACVKIKEPDCQLYALQLWKQKSYPAEFGVDLASIILQSDNCDEKSLWPLFKWAYGSPLAKFLCKKDSVKKALFTQLHYELNHRGEGFQKKYYSNLISSECFEQLKPGLKESLFDYKDFKREIAFYLLDMRESLNDVEKSYFYISYILGQPSPGELFNVSWNHLQTLSQDYKSRMKVIAFMEKLDLIPGALFESINIKKKNIIKKYLKNTIPEFFQMYAKKCVSFMEGNEFFPSGNPTPQCQSFMRGVRDQDVISHDVLSKYDRLRKGALKESY